MPARARRSADRIARFEAPPTFAERSLMMTTRSGRRSVIALIQRLHIGRRQSAREQIEAGKRVALEATLAINPRLRLPELDESGRQILHALNAVMSIAYGWLAHEVDLIGALQ